jgi:hypothetical protein
MVAALDPNAFISLAKAMNKIEEERRERGESVPNSNGRPAVDGDRASRYQAGNSAEDSTGLVTAQRQFFQGTNVGAMKGILGAIESQVDRLLPEKISSSARNGVIGEIYRELDASLQANSQFTRQVRGAFRSGNLDTAHQNAVVSLIVGRARQALPSVAKRVLSEWTSTILAANQDQHSRQRSAESRVDIAGSRGGGNEGHRARSPREIDYGRMSDADILNL